MTSGFKESIARLLTELKIEKIIVVDDQFDKTEDDRKNIIKALCISLHNQGKQTELKRVFGDSINFSDSPDVWQSGIDSTWSTYTGEQKLAAAKHLTSISGNKEILDCGFVASIGEIFEGVQISFLGINDWKANKKTIIKGISKKKKLLILFDENLGNGQKGTVFAKALIDGTKKKGESNVFCGILSYDILIESEIDFIKNNLGETYSKYIHPLGKERLYDNESFLNGIKRVVLNFYCYLLKEEFQKSMISINSDSLKQLKEINIIDFDQIIFRSSYAEGALEIDTLLRIYYVYHRRETHKIILKDRKIQSLTNIIRSVSLISMNKDLSSQNAHTFERLQRFDETDLINEFHLPIDTGDVFEINGNYYILISQNCDLVIRKEGERGLNQGLLIPFQKNEPPDIGAIRNSAEKLKNLINSRQVEPEVKLASTELLNLTKEFYHYDKFFLLEYFMENPKTKYHLDFKKTISIDFRILDLCVFSSDGKAIFNKSNLSLPYLTTGWKKRFDDLCKFYKSVKSKQNLEKKLGNNIYPFNFRYYKNKTIIFPIKRIKRLKKQYAYEIVLKYAQFISRFGLDHDFTKL